MRYLNKASVAMTASSLALLGGVSLASTSSATTPPSSPTYQAQKVSMNEVDVHLNGATATPKGNKIMISDSAGKTLGAIDTQQTVSGTKLTAAKGATANTIKFTRSSTSGVTPYFDWGCAAEKTGVTAAGSAAGGAVTGGPAGAGAGAVGGAVTGAVTSIFDC